MWLFEFAAAEIAQIARAGENGGKGIRQHMVKYDIFRQKRKWAETEEDEAKVEMEGEDGEHQHPEGRSPPPSSCSSVENQPQSHQHGQQQNQLLISAVKEETE